MEGPSIANREEAEKCASIAQDALKRGDRQKAEKFLAKSMRLYPNSLAAELISQLQNESTSSSSSSSSANNNTRARSKSPPKRNPSPPRSTTKPPSPRARSSSSPKSRSGSSSGGTPGGEYTVEQREAALAIKRCKNHYEILSVSKQATEKEVKAAYRKLALKFHPDKNKAPEAEEAFKMVSHAFQILSDPAKKRHYDEYGEDEAGTNQRHHAAAAAAYAQRARQEDLTPEDIFRMFFQGGMGGGFATAGGGQFYGRRVYRERREHREEEGNPSPFSQLAHFLPLILLLLFSLFSMPSSTEDIPFTFDRTPATQLRRETPKHTEYFVSTSFASRYARDPRSLSQIEQLVEQHAYNRAKEECIRQQAEHKRLINEARKSKGETQADLLDKAANFNMDACDRKRKLEENI